MVKNLGIKLILLNVMIVAIVVALAYYSSCRQAQVYNTTHQTQWTCSDFFWAVNQINTKINTINVNK